MHELRGYEGMLRAEPVSLAVLQGDEVALASAFAWLDEADRCVADLPLQVTTASLAALPEPLRVWRLDTAQIIASLNAQGDVAIHCLLDLDPRQRNAEVLVQGLRRHLPDAASSCPRCSGWISAGRPCSGLV